MGTLPVPDEDKAYDIEVMLSEKIYNPGDRIQGLVEFRLRRKLFCDTITAQLYGYAKVFWTTNELENTSFQRVAHGQKRVLIDEKVVVWSAQCKKRPPPEPTIDDIVRYSSSTAIRPMKVARSSDDCGLEAGTHSLFFEFQLPKHGLYTSFEQHQCYGCVRYFIVVQCMNNDQLMAKRKLLFPVVCLANLLNNPNATHNHDVTRNVTITKNQYVNVEVQLERKGFVPAERIPIRILIDNQSGKSVKHAHLSIVQHALCLATYPEPCNRDCYFQTSGVGLPVPKIPNGQLYKYAPEFHVPALVPDFEIAGCIRVDHELKLEIGFNRNEKPKHAICIIKIPIFIGTSIGHNPGGALIQEDRQGQEDSGAIAAPLQDGPMMRMMMACNGYELSARSPSPPPTYMESVCGRSLVDEHDDEICPSYTPLYLAQPN